MSEVVPGCNGLLADWYLSSGGRAWWRFVATCWAGNAWRGFISTCRYYSCYKHFQHKENANLQEDIAFSAPFHYQYRFYFIYFLVSIKEYALCRLVCSGVSKPSPEPNLYQWYRLFCSTNSEKNFQYLWSPCKKVQPIRWYEISLEEAEMIRTSKAMSSFLWKVKVSYGVESFMTAGSGNSVPLVKCLSNTHKNPTPLWGN